MILRVMNGSKAIIFKGITGLIGNDNNNTMGDGRRGSPETKWYLYRGGNATRGILMPVNISL